MRCPDAVAVYRDATAMASRIRGIRSMSCGGVPATATWPTISTATTPTPTCGPFRTRRWVWRRSSDVGPGLHGCSSGNPLPDRRDPASGTTSSREAVAPVRLDPFHGRDVRRERHRRTSATVSRPDPAPKPATGSSFGRGVHADRDVRREQPESESEAGWSDRESLSVTRYRANVKTISNPMSATIATSSHSKRRSRATPSSSSSPSCTTRSLLSSAVKRSPRSNSAFRSS